MFYIFHTTCFFYTDFLIFADFLFLSSPNVFLSSGRLNPVWICTSTKERWGACFTHDGEKAALHAVVGEFSRENVNNSSVAALAGVLAFVESFSKIFEN